MSRKESAKKSEIWNFFEMKPKSDKIAVCNICKTDLSYKSSSNNLRKHMQRKHPLVKMNSSENQSRPIISSASEADVQPMEVDSVDTNEHAEELPSTSGTASTSNNNPRTIISKPAKIQSTVSTFLHKKLGVNARKTIDQALMLLFTHDFQPFSIVEDFGFRKFISALNPSYQLPNRKTVTNTLLPAKYEEIYNKTKEELKEVDSVTLTTDCWTSSTTESFLAVTAHFLTKNFELKHRVLGCESFSESHTSANLASAIRNILVEWDLENKVLIFISDNAANIKKAIKEELRQKHFGCYAHTINLIAQNSIKQASEILNKVKTVVAYFRRSSAAMGKFFDQQRLLKIEPTKRLVQDVVTRWNSTFYMVERFVELEEPIRTTMALIEHDLPIISVEEWQFMKELVEILRPLEDVTKVMSGQNYVTASSVIILTDGLLDIYRELQNKDYSIISKAVIVAIMDGITSRLGNLESSNSLLITTFLDPRFKNIAFSNDSITERTKKLITSLITGNIKNKTSLSDQAQQESVQVENKATETSIWRSFDKKISVLKPQGSAQSRAIIEFQRYLEEPPISRNEDPLKWWKNNSYNFPHLSAVVKQKFMVVATSVPCERLFSKSSIVLSDRRNSLRSTKVKKILFLNCNQE